VLKFIFPQQAAGYYGNIAGLSACGTALSLKIATILFIFIPLACSGEFKLKEFR